MIIEHYTEKYYEEFKELSYSWLKEYDLLEESDEIMLNNPELIINNGGYIFIALHDNTLIGTISLEKINNKEYEILKLGVSKEHQGKGIGKKLMEYVIQLGKEKEILKLILHSNRKLTSAISLYTKLGFEEINLVENKFLTADIKMELKML
ncbi:GNAT family N-acetyltransferase [Tenacibaculum sp. Bg11-29]|uniref:GNAT family N-acetyltransferase n=1 Tax=Tenacibaculum sp. Bg11-29 TaxID=2058306 RepID=UPI000C3421FB|nr:GNAT family N-acetyltransferase [Tenacibaculum sp. Bg11-29]PKH52542.1 GNAT family N-acetyltransferase [Tenacibaculum sp. Bg11-29]